MDYVLCNKSYVICLLSSLVGIVSPDHFEPLRGTVQNGPANVHIRICLLAFRPLCGTARISVSVTVSEPPTTRRHGPATKCEEGRRQRGVKEGSRRAEEVSRRGRGGVEEESRRG